MQQPQEKLSFVRVSGRAIALLLSSTIGLGHAQSVDMFGVLDLNLRNVKNGGAGTLKSVSTDGLSTSRIGWRGVEDLGDGLKAGFWLESAVLPDVGSSNATKFFNRRSTVSIIDPRAGELRLGRDNVPTFTAIGVYDPFGTNGLGEVLGSGTGVGLISTLGSGTNTLTRADNQVSYFLPALLGGMYGQLALTAGEGKIGDKVASGRIGFAKGPFDLSLSYAESTVAAGDKFKQSVLGGFYDFGVAKAMVQWVQSRYGSAAGGARKQDVYEIGAIVPVSSKANLHLGYTYGAMSGGAALSGFANDDDAGQIGARYVYNLSTRTALYGAASQLRNKGASRLTIAAGPAGIKAGETSSGFEAGIRHSF